MRIYKAPSEEMKAFLADTIPKLSGFESLQSQDLAKLLISKSDKKVPFNTNQIGDSFSWLHKIGVLDYKSEYVKNGGWRLFLFRKCGETEADALIISNGDAVIGDKKKPSESGKKPCCDNMKIVKSKKTGKRFCKNCKTEHPKKKKTKAEKMPAACAPCCDNPHPVRSKKTGKRFCKNCKTLLKPKKKK